VSQDVTPLHRELIHVVRLMVEEPAEVRVEERQDGSYTRFNVCLPSRDLGKVIGRQGRTARALRALLAARGEQNGQRYGLEIREA